MYRGVEACRMRLARHALAHGDAPLLRWALVDACTVPLTPQACSFLWEWATTSGSATCARVLVDAAARPQCACGCLGEGKDDRACSVTAVVVRAAKHGHDDMMDVLIDRTFVPVACWLHFVMWDAVVDGRIAMLEFLVERGVLMPGTAKMPPCRARIGQETDYCTWVESAAHKGQSAVLSWLVAHRVDLNGLDMALIRASRNGHAATATWLCERRHLEHFARAFATALKNRHYLVAEAMLAFGREARVRYEADGDTLGQAVARAQKDLAVDDTDARAAMLVHRLLGP